MYTSKNQKPLFSLGEFLGILLGSFVVAALIVSQYGQHWERSSRYQLGTLLGIVFSVVLIFLRRRKARIEENL